MDKSQNFRSKRLNEDFVKKKTLFEIISSLGKFCKLIKFSKYQYEFVWYYATTISRPW